MIGTTLSHYHITGDRRRWRSVPDLDKLFNLQEMISIQHVRIGITFSFDARFLGIRDFPILASALLL